MLYRNFAKGRANTDPAFDELNFPYFLSLFLDAKKTIAEEPRRKTTAKISFVIRNPYAAEEISHPPPPPPPSPPSPPGTEF